MNTDPPKGLAERTAAGATRGSAARDLLEAWDLYKAYPGVQALSDVNFDVRAGEIHAVMGQNGAGKSTLIKVLTGAVRPDDGAMQLLGSGFAPESPAHATARGVCAVYQETNLVPTLSVAENLFLGRQPRGPWGINWRSMRRQARDATGILGMNVDVDAPVGSLPVAAQQMVAVARAVRSRAKVIIFDEPTSSLDHRETERLFELMRALRGQGLGLVFITHFLDQVFRIADRVTVLRNGKNVGTLGTGQISRSELVGWMLGSKGASASVAPHARSGDNIRVGVAPALRAKKIGKRRLLEPFDLHIRPGEVVGLAGLLGSGRTETAQLLFGIVRRDSGSIEIDGRTTAARSPRRAIVAGIGLMPEDRKADGLFLEMSIRDNIAMVAQRRLGFGLGLMRRRRHSRLARRLVEQLGIATPSIRRPVGTLSGGNQQKVLLARWLAVKPRILIMDEPTRGVDVGGKAQIELLVEQLSKAGMAVLFISAELEEVARRCDRVVVLRDRRRVGELEGVSITEKAIMVMIAGPEHA